MRELALNIRENLDALTAEYGQLLRDIPAYAGMPEQSRLSAARSAIQLVAAGLEAGDRDLFVQFTRATAVERVAQGFEIEDVQRALDALAEVVEPLLSTVEAANFLWRVVVQSHTALSQMAMERVKRSQKALQTFMDSTPFGVVVIGRDKKVRRANKAALALMECESEEQVVGRMCHDTLCPAEVGKCPILDLGQDIDRSERVLVTGEGKHIPVLKSVVSVTLDGEEALLETFVDISERKRMEEELRESEERFRSLVESAHTGILVVDDAYRFTYVNDELCQILGRTRDEVIGLDFRAVLDEESRRLVADRYARRQRGEDVPPRYEFNVVRKDGEKRRVEISTVVVRDSAGNPRTMAHLTDVTGRERLEREVRESLERRGHQVRTGTEVSQEIAAATGLDELFRRVVVLIKERFGYYHAQIFRYEPAVDAVVLVVGYGETGEQMLAAGHRLEMGRGVVGTAAATGRPVLAADVARDEAWVPNPFLPQTEGELAVPIKWRDEVLGILDVQSETAGALTEEDQLLLEGLCGQIAIAIEDTRLRQEMEENLRELERLTRAMSREGWEAFRREAGPTGYLFDQFTVVSADDYWAPEIGMAVKRGMIVPPTSDERPAAVTPLLVRGEVIGALGVHDDPQNPLSQGDLALVNLVSEQVAQALESARLFEQTQATLAQTEEMYAASEGVVRATTMDEVLQAVIHSTILQRLAHCTIQLFDHPWGDERPHAMTVVANWERDASSGVPAPAGGGSLIPVGTRHVLAQFPATRWFDREEPRIVRDIATDEYVDENTRALFLDQLGMRSMIILPLVAGEQWIGILSAMGDAVLEVDEAEVRQITSLTGQAAAVIQSLRLLEDAQARVRRERALQEITAAISASGGLDDLMARLSAIVGLLRQLVTVDVLTLATYIPGEPEYTLFALSSIKGSEAAVSEETETGHFAQPGTHLPVEGTGPGWAITHREPWLEEDIRREMPFAEDEQLVAEGVVSRVLLPLLAGEQVVGAFSLGSTQPGAFTREHLPFLRQVADQIALALERARLLEETSAALDEAEATHRAYLRRGWQDYLRQQELLRQGGFLYDRMQDAPGFDGPISPVAGLWRPEMERALTEGRPARASDDGNEEKRTGFAIPIVLRGQTIGVLGVEDPDGETRWSEDDRVVIEAVGQQLALALENARLLDATRQRAEQERIISDVTTRVRASMDLESILQTAVRELGAALGTDRAFIRLGAGARSNDKNDKSQNLNLEGRDE